MTASSTSIAYPAPTIRDSCVAHLRTALSSILSSGEIRALLDVSSDSPKDIRGVVVSATDNGATHGTADRRLVDIGVSVTLYHHLDEDPEGTLFDSLQASVFSALSSWAPSASGWTVSYSTPVIGAGVTGDGVFRSSVFSTTLYLQQA